MIPVAVQQKGKEATNGTKEHESEGMENPMHFLFVFIRGIRGLNFEEQLDD